jgi:hypothetical protein
MAVPQHAATNAARRSPGNLRANDGEHADAYQEQVRCLTQEAEL